MIFLFEFAKIFDLQNVTFLREMTNSNRFEFNALLLIFQWKNKLTKKLVNLCVFRFSKYRVFVEKILRKTFTSRNQRFFVKIRTLQMIRPWTWIKIAMRIIITFNSITFQKKELFFWQASISKRRCFVPYFVIYHSQYLKFSSNVFNLVRFFSAMFRCFRKLLCP